LNPSGITKAIPRKRDFLFWGCRWSLLQWGSRRNKKWPPQADGFCSKPSAGDHADGVSVIPPGPLTNKC